MISPAPPLPRAPLPRATVLRPLGESGDALARQRRDAIAAGVGDGAEHHAREPAGCRAKQAGEVAVEQRIPVAEQKARGEDVACMQKSAPGAGALGLFRDRDGDRARQGATDRVDRFSQPLGEVAGEEDEIVDAEADHLAHQPGEERPVADRQDRLRGGLGERTEAARHSAGEDHALSDRGFGHGDGSTW